MLRFLPSVTVELKSDGRRISGSVVSVDASFNMVLENCGWFEAPTGRTSSSSSSSASDPRSRRLDGSGYNQTRGCIGRVGPWDVVDVYPNVFASQQEKEEKDDDDSSGPPDGDEHDEEHRSDERDDDDDDEYGRYGGGGGGGDDDDDVDDMDDGAPAGGRRAEESEPASSSSSSSDNSSSSSSVAAALRSVFIRGTNVRYVLIEYSPSEIRQRIKDGTEREEKARLKGGRIKRKRTNG